MFDLGRPNESLCLSQLHDPIELCRLESPSTGATTSARSQHTRRNAGQLGSFPIAATTQSPTENTASRLRQSARSSSTSWNVRKTEQSSEKITGSRLLFFRTCLQKRSNSLCSTCVT
jgi:hypothetical protein